jgi:hypothetical protein
MVEETAVELAAEPDHRRAADASLSWISVDQWSPPSIDVVM